MDGVIHLSVGDIICVDRYPPLPFFGLRKWIRHPVPVSALFQWTGTPEKVRKMNIYVGNLPFSASEDDVREAFSAYGEVSSVALIKDKVTGKPRGFGFVEMPNNTEAQQAINELNGKDFKGRSLVVNQARPREDRGERRNSGYDRRNRN
jgi:RNA recognition motif-containing protein